MTLTETSPETATAIESNTPVRSMKVLFINDYLPQEMLGIMWLSRSIKDAGHQTKALFLPDADWIKKIGDYTPDVVCFSVTTGMHLYYFDIAKRIRKEYPEMQIIFGGPHPTFSPEMLEMNEHVDAICRGEGELAIVEYLDKLAAGEDTSFVQNMWVRDRKTGEIAKNPQRTPIQDLDSLGFPDREVIYDAGSIYAESDRKVFVTQRGCPMNCSFCFHHALKKKVVATTNAKYVRKRSVDHVIAEIKHVRDKYNLKFIHFLDDIFNLSGKWLDEFCEKYPKEIGIPFDVILMANMTREHHIEKLQKAGCVYARVAFESANEYIRNAVFRKNTTLKQLEDSAGWIKKYGIRLGSLNMLGGPGASLDDELETVALNIRCKVDHPLVSIMQPYPMFDIEDMTKEMGYAVAAYDDFPVKFNRTSSIEFDNKREIENLHKLFPIIVRNGWMMKFVKPMIRQRWLSKVYLIMYMLHSEWMVSEQAKLYAHAQGLSGMRYWKSVDFVRRVSVKGVIRTYENIFGKISQRIAMKLQMGDERVIAHMD
ncbi:MAG: anaerobic magnesium-protoporphyrin IX monomethyl ester cyclase [Planctomycetota bacterium]|jgi:anaerobic magnesium-protoporphyrin IX monomethyl ester cyclase